jgi:glycosyltransferase involved in cell wall biosynthesis
MLNSQIEFADNTCLVKDPLVSVVMITYNHERYLAEAIEGVVRQETSFSVELLIGEDCSTDETREIALSYQKRFPEMIRVITSEQNVGMHKNLARLLAAARGQYIAFCEGDDVWIRSEKLERQIALLESNPDISLVCSNYQIISDSGAILNSNVHRSPNGREYCVTLEDVLLSGVVLTLTACARRELVMRALGESPLCREHTYLFGDTPLWVELARYGKCCCVPEVFCSYRRSNNSATRQPDPFHTNRFSASSCEFFNDALDLYPLPGGGAATLEAKVRFTRARLRAVAILGDPGNARKQLQRLKELGVRPTIKDNFLSLFAHFVRPRTLGAAAMATFLSTWRTIRY